MCTSLTHSSPNSEWGFGNSWDSHRIMFSPSLCNNHHTKSVIRPTATPGSCSVRYGTCLNPRARSLPQFPTTMQIHSARDRSQYPSSCARAAALKEGEDTKQKKSFRFKWKYHHHSPWKKKKLLGSYFQEPVYLSARLLLAIVVVWTIYKRITEAEEAGAAICFRWTALRIHEDDYKFLLGQFLQNGSFWHKDKKSSKIDAKRSDTWESLSFLPSVKCSPEHG